MDIMDSRISMLSIIPLISRGPFMYVNIVGEKRTGTVGYGGILALKNDGFSQCYRRAPQLVLDLSRLPQDSNALGFGPKRLCYSGRLGRYGDTQPI